jgi:hypothetical protein
MLLSLCVVGIAVLTMEHQVFTALSFILFGGYIATLLKYFRGGKISFDDMFTLDNRWISFTFLSLIKALLILLGLLCFIVPGIYLCIRWMFAEFFVLEEGMGPIAALRASAAMTKGRVGELFLFSALCVLLVALGSLCFLVGGIVALIVVLFASMDIYTRLSK